MNFSAFGGFTGIHQFAAKFSHEAQTGAFTSTAGNSVASGGGQELHHSQRYHTNTNHFNQNTTSVGNTSMQYSQNISIPYSQPQNDLNFLNNEQKNKIHTKMERDRDEVLNQQLLQNVNQSWQTLANPTNTVDYSSHLLSTRLPISIQHFLKYSTESIKKEPQSTTNINNGIPINSGNINLGSITDNSGMNLNGATNQGNNGGINNGIIGSGFNIKTDLLGLVGSNGQPVGNGNAPPPTNTNHMPEQQTNVAEATTTTGKKKRKKAPKQQKKRVQPPKEKKPRPKPGEIRETKALDGSTLYCCPECQMAYPDRSLIEQHVISHAVERRFVCDICNAALKRKDHLTRHKLSHIPDRPHVCNICMKSFKRKEQLTLHIVIHSGEKKHVCQECGKGFYRKDHLRKHTRSHIARRVKSEVTAQNTATSTTTAQNGGPQGVPIQPS